jgi:catalase
LLIADLDQQAADAGAQVKIIAPRIGGIMMDDGTRLAADFQLAGGPSVLFDAVVLVLSEDGAEALGKDPAAIAFVQDAFHHCKVIGFVPAARSLTEKAGIGEDSGVVELSNASAKPFLKQAAKGRIWDRERDADAAD